jgi:hypothetical protein
MIGNHNRNGRVSFAPLHDDMASALSHFRESMRTKDGADFDAGQNAEFTHA